MVCKKCLFRLLLDPSKAGRPAPQKKPRTKAKPFQTATVSNPIRARRSYFQVASARPKRFGTLCKLKWFLLLRELRLWCWPPCVGQIEEESKKTFVEPHPRTQKLIILKPRGQKLQSRRVWGKTRMPSPAWPSERSRAEPQESSSPGPQGRVV